MEYTKGKRIRKKNMICHVTTVHSRSDVRIFYKQCRTLSTVQPITLIVADGRGNEVVDNVKVLDVGLPGSRLERVFYSQKKILEIIKGFKAKVYHLHDPELILISRKLKKEGATVIFDSHEDVALQILSKEYLPLLVRYLFSFLYVLIEKFFLKYIDFVITATDRIEKKYSKKGCRSFSIKNYPILRTSKEVNGFLKNSNKAVYIGGISERRGAITMLDSLSYAKDIKLVLAGRFFTSAVEDKMRNHSNWKHVSYRGWLGRRGVEECLRESCVGLVLLHPVRSYVESLPVKMFEYMNEGLPVVASNFPGWEEVIIGDKCGICVDPLNPKEIAAAIDKLVNDPVLAKQMGENGQLAVREKYNWEVEGQKLLRIYREILSEELV